MRTRVDRDVWKVLCVTGLLGLLALASISIAWADDVVITDGDVDQLIAEIAAANASGDPTTISLTEDGEYVLAQVDNTTTGANGLPVITGDLTIDGNGATIRRSGDDETPWFRIFTVSSDGQLHLDELNISGGHEIDAGGIFNDGVLTLTDSTISENEARDDGGGILNNGSLLLTNSTVSDNLAYTGAGLYSGGSSTLTLNDSTVGANVADEHGGGIWNDGSLALTDSTVTDNRAAMDGGGIYNSGSGVVTLTDTTINENDTGDYGGGIFNSGPGSLTLTRTTVGDNSAFIGGGIYNGGPGSVTLAESTVSDNSSRRGGGVHSFGHVNVLSSTVSGNFAFSGGGILNDGGTVIMTNSTLSGNDATQGGGISNLNGGSLATIQGTLSDNAAGLGGGIFNGEDSSIFLRNTILAGNSEVDLLNNGTLVPESSGNLTTGDPMLGPLQDNGGPTETMALLPGSPAIDATATCTESRDQRGILRPQGEACDIGAFEFANLPPVAESQTVVTDQNTQIAITLVATDPQSKPLSFDYSQPENGSLTGDAPEVVYVPESGFVGEDSFTFTVNNGDLDSDPATVTVTVRDTTPPVISNLPNDITAEATAPVGAIIDYEMPEAIDEVDGAVPVSCDPEPGSTFSLGETIVECTATDEAGNQASASFTVTVEDTTPPVISNVPDDISAEAAGPDGATVQYSLPTAVDTVDGSLPVTCDFIPGSTFALGETEVECSASDEAGNLATEAFSVTVKDTTPPDISNVPDDITIETTNPDGVAVDYELPQATDVVDGAVPVSCDPESDSIFAPGETEVECSASDLTGNETTARFTVTVELLPDVPPTDPPGQPDDPGPPAQLVLEFDVTQQNVGNPVTITVLVLDADGNQVGDGIEITFQVQRDGENSDQAELLEADFPVTVETENGAASVSYTSHLKGTDTIIVSAGDLNASGTINWTEDADEPGEPVDPPDFACVDEITNPYFWSTWARTDLPVRNLDVSRTWMWGPCAFTESMSESYAESPDGEREVAYFDKARMEINQPDADSDALWYVTNGLLVVELITGQRQFGDDLFDYYGPAEVNVAGDLDDLNSPTYAAFSGVLDAPAQPVDSLLTERIDRDGTVTDDNGYAGHEVRVAFVDEVTNHSIAAPFWEFMNSEGLVYENGTMHAESLFENPFYATGRPIAEAYWATVSVAGEPRDVLMQCFERRCLTYTPGNADGFVVEAGNVGQHYFTWRYVEAID